MNILRIIYDWPPPWHGLAPAPYEITRSQLKLGHKLTVFCGRWPSAGPLEQIQGVDIQTFYREPFPGTLNITSSVLLFFYYLKWRRNNHVDIIHSHGHFAIWIYFYRFILQKFFPWAKELQVPLIAHFHNTVAGRADSLLKKDQQIKFHSKYLSWPLAEFSDKLAVRVAEACIFVSQDTRMQALNHYEADPEKCFVIESGVNTDLFKPIGVEEFEKTRRDLNLDPLDKVIINTGVMLERKNIHLLIEALALLPHNFKLLLVGPGDSDYLIKLQELITKKHLESRIIQVGYTPYPQQPISYQSANLFVLPSSFEGLPKVAIEALACGVPALVSGFKFKDEIEGVYYLEKLEPQYIADYIQEIISKPKNVNVARIHNLYSWEDKAKQMEKVYEFAKNQITN